MKELHVHTQEQINDHYLRLDMLWENQPCGTIDLIAGKINFNLLGKKFFKGMAFLDSLQIEHDGERCIVLFQGGKTLIFGCRTETFSAIDHHVRKFRR